MCLSQEEELERLEREFAIQSQITEAARRLASDPHVSSKKLKKQRKTSYLNALKKLQEIENSINEYRVRSGKKPTQRASLIIEGTNIILQENHFFFIYYIFISAGCSWHRTVFFTSTSIRLVTEVHKFNNEADNIQHYCCFVITQSLAVVSLTYRSQYWF